MGREIKVSMAVGQKERKQETNKSLMSGCRENNGYLSNLGHHYSNQYGNLSE